MKIKLNRLASAIVLALLCPLAGHSQSKTVPRAWEFGLGGAAMNVTRTTVSNFHQTSGGDYIFNLDEKMLYGGVELYSAVELKKWLYADLQGILGFAKYYESESQRQGYSLMVSPGIQFRPFVRSGWIQPYLRLGVNYYHKNFRLPISDSSREMSQKRPYGGLRMLGIKDIPLIQTHFSLCPPASV